MLLWVELQPTPIIALGVHGIRRSCPCCGGDDAPDR
jgi:hypothetical protein